MIKSHVPAWRFARHRVQAHSSPVACSSMRVQEVTGLVHCSVSHYCGTDCLLLQNRADKKDKRSRYSEGHDSSVAE